MVLQIYNIRLDLKNTILGCKIPLIRLVLQNTRYKVGPTQKLPDIRLVLQTTMYGWSYKIPDIRLVLQNTRYKVGPTKYQILGWSYKIPDTKYDVGWSYTTKYQILGWSHKIPLIRLVLQNTILG